MTSKVISPLCRQVRHTACEAQDLDCDCECHEAGFSGVRERVADVAPNGQFPCREPTCDHRPFSTVQGESVHYARMHKNGSAPQPKDAPVIEADEEIEEEQPLAPLVADVLAALAFIEGSDEQSVLDRHLDEWAAGELDADDDVRALVAMRQRHRDA